MRIRISIVLTAGLALIVLLAATLSQSPRVLAGTNGVAPATEIADIHSSTRLCQGEEALPAGTSALRIALNMALGTRLTVSVLAGTRVIARGIRASAWRGTEVTVPLSRALSTAERGTVCVNLGASNEPVGLIGEAFRSASPARVDGKPLVGRVRIEYLSDGQRTWWASASSIARRMGLGRAWSGGGISLLVLALMGSIVSLASWLAIRSLP